MLKRDGYLEEHDGALYVALETGPAEEYTSDGIEYVIRPARQENLSGLLAPIRRITKGQTYLVAENIAEQFDYEGVLIRHNDVETRMFFVATVDGDVVQTDQLFRASWLLRKREVADHDLGGATYGERTSRERIHI